MTIAVVCLCLGFGGGWLAHRAPAPVLRVASADCLVDSINQARAAAGVRPLSPDPVLAAGATAHSQAMAAVMPVSIWHDMAWVASHPEGSVYDEENVGVGSTCDLLASAFLASPEHKANMINPLVNRLGVGWASGNGYLYVTERFIDVPSAPVLPLPAATRTAASPRALPSPSPRC